MCVQGMCSTELKFAKCYGRQVYVQTAPEMRTIHVHLLVFMDPAKIYIANFAHKDFSINQNTVTVMKKVLKTKS